MKQFFLVTIFCLSLTHLSNAQNNPISTNSMPNWVAMIDNPSTNYYEAINAFKLYWKDRITPEGDEDESLMSKEERKERELYEKRRMKMNASERQYDDQINYQYKRFKNWANEIKPYVQDDGRILTMDERIAIWNQQQLELKNKR